LIQQDWSLKVSRESRDSTALLSCCTVGPNCVSSRVSQPCDIVTRSTDTRGNIGNCPSKRESHQFVSVYCNYVVGSRHQWSKLTLGDVYRHFKDDGLQIAANGVEVSKLTLVFLSLQIASRPFTEWFNVLTMHKSGDTACHRLEGSKMTATDAAPQESGDTASGAGVSIITSSMKTLLASQRSLINTRFCFFLFFYGSAENSQKNPPDWGRLEYVIFQPTS